MEGWFKDTGSPALLDALTNVCSRLEDDYRARLKSHSDEIEALRARASIVDDLEKQNRTLQKEVEQLQRNLSFKSLPCLGDGDVASAANIRTPLAPRSTNQSVPSALKESSKPEKLDTDGLRLPELRAAYSNLETKYGKLQERYLVVEGARKNLDQLLRENRKNVERWVDHANKINAQSQKRLQKVKKLEAKLASVTSDILEPSPSFEGGTQKDGPELIEEHQKLPAVTDKGVNGVSDEGSTQAPSSDSSHENDGIDGLAPSRRAEHTANKSTSVIKPVIKAEPSSDPPVIVSERSLRKRRREEYDNTHADTPAPARIKRENGSSPEIIDERHHFSTHEDVDFDDEATTVETPRKHRSNWPYEEDSTTFRPQEKVNDNGNGTDGHITSAARRKRETTMSNAVTSDPVLTRRAPEFSSALHPLPGALEPLLQSLHRPGSSHRTTTSTPRQYGIASLAEDGDEGSTTMRNATGGRLSKTNNLLDVLLNSPTLGRESLALSSALQRGDSTTVPKPGSYAAAPRKRELPFGSGKAARPRSPLKPATMAAECKNTRTDTPVQHNRGKPNDSIPPSMSKPQKQTPKTTQPLRSKPLSVLRLDDFKINPKANEGYDFAFTDVYRSKDDRASLTGCIRDSCCGQSFRAAARAMRLLPSVTPSTFQALVESHLGDDAWRLAMMTTEEKEEIWIDAKTRELADRHGRHRHRYHRMPSPPGFWRTDFPDTQEGEEDRRKAELMERETVETRYREAMREGGLWLFRDE